MARHIKRGESLWIPFRNGESITDSQLRPRMYKSMKAFMKEFPHTGTKEVEVIEYAEVVHGYTIVAEEPVKVLLDRKCSICDQLMLATDNYCSMCGAKNDGERIM